MRELRKLAWTAVFAAVAAAPAAAQQGSVISGGGGQSFGSLSGAGGLTGGGAGQLGGGGGGGGGGGTGGSSSGGLGGSALQSSALQTLTAPPKLSPPTGSASSSLNKTNFLAGYYANPYYQGTISAGTNGTPGGFGIASGTTGTGSVNRGGLGAGAGGRGQSSSNQSGILIALPVQINYSAKMMFATPPVAAGKLQSEIRGLINNTSEIANPKNVQIITDADNNVTIRGTVKDGDEARLIEGLVRLTPGVGGITNELTATSSASPGK
jgi:hypothetical protein